VAEYKERKPVARDLKSIYRAATMEEAELLPAAIAMILVPLPRRVGPR
jgi:hypothetical protein